MTKENKATIYFFTSVILGFVGAVLIEETSIQFMLVIAQLVFLGLYWFSGVELISYFIKLIRNAKNKNKL